MRKVLFLTAVLAFVFTSSVWATDISGKWTLKMSGRQGEESIPVVVRVAGENLTLTAVHPALTAMEGTGTVKGDAVNFNLKVGGEIQIDFVFTGKVTGNKMAGTREVKVSAGRGGPGGQGGPPSGGEPPAGGQGDAPGGQGGAPTGGEQQPPGGGQGAAPGGQGNAAVSSKVGDWGQSVSNAWTAEKN
jgi:hypothetical protein